MAIEAMRGCGFRKVGGLYLCGESRGMNCDRLPYELVICPTCGGGVKFTRGWTWLDWDKYAGEHEDCYEKLPTEKIETSLGPATVILTAEGCPVCRPDARPQPYGLLWIGEQFYTPHTFIQEAMSLGVSRRISAVPKKLKLGETWVLLAHKSAIRKIVAGDENEPVDKDVPGVFYAFRPQTLELLVWESEATPEHLEDLAKRGITAVVIPNDDIDHHPDTKTKMTESDRSMVEQSNKIAAIRARLRR